MSESRLGIVIDSSGAKRGGGEVVRSLEQIRAAARQVNQAVASAEKALGHTAVTAGLMRRASDELSGSLNSTIGRFLTFGAIAGGLKVAFDAMDRLAASNRKLAGEARLSGLSLDGLRAVAGRANEQFQLGTRLSNEYATAAAKLANKAGDLSQASRALESILNIGAAKGLSSAESLEAINQAILGIDEGTDKLFGKNPSVIYAEYAASIHTTVGRLNDQQKAQALLNATIQGGEKTRGEYSAWLQTNAGQQAQLAIKTEQSAARIGVAMDGLRTATIPALSGLAEGLANFVAGIQVLAVDLGEFVDEAKVELNRLRTDEGKASLGRQVRGWWDVQWQSLIHPMDGDELINRLETARINADGVRPRDVQDRLDAIHRGAQQVRDEIVKSMMSGFTNAALLGGRGAGGNGAGAGGGATGSGDENRVRDAVRSLNGSLFDARYGGFGDLADRAKDLRRDIQEIGDNITRAGHAVPAGSAELLGRKRAELESVLQLLQRAASAGGLGTPNLTVPGLYGIPANHMPGGGLSDISFGPSWARKGIAAPDKALDAAMYKATGARKSADEFGEAVRAAQVGLDDLAAALGDLGEPLRGALQGIASLSQGFSQIKASKGLGGIAGIAGMIGGIGAVIGGVASLGKAIGGLLHPPPNPVIVANTKALEHLRDALKGAVTFGNAASAQARLQAMLGAGGLARFGAGLNAGDLTELKRVAESVGIQLVNEKGKLVAGALKQLEEALRLSAQTVKEFGKSLEGARRLADARRDIFEITDPAAAVKDQYELLLKGLSEAAEVRFGLAGINTSTKGGQDALEDGLRKLFDSFANGGLSTSDLAGFSSVDEFLQAILGADNALDRLRETTDKLNGSMINEVSGYRLRGAVWQVQDARTMPGGPASAPTGPATGDPGVRVNYGGVTIQLVAGDRSISQLVDELEQELAKRARADGNVGWQVALGVSHVAQ